MSKLLDPTTLLSSAAMVARKAETYLPEAFVVDLAEIAADYLGDATGQ
jgi:hypothetical protein